MIEWIRSGSFICHDIIGSSLAISLDSETLHYLGLLIAFYMSKQFKHAQPALLYLVPLVLSFISLRAYYEGRFSEYWNGKKPKNTN
eukprot:gene20312-26365_t